MANVAQTLATAVGHLKISYQGPLVSGFNDEVPIYRGASNGSHKYQGQQVNRPLKVRRNPGTGATSDGGTLPAANKQTTQQAVINCKYNYLRFMITAQTIAASRSDAGAFVRGTEFELKEGYNDLKSTVNRQMSWDGTGDLARVNTAPAASTTLVIKGREDTEAALKFLDVGSVFDIYTSAGVLVQSGITINSITSGDATSATATVVCNVAVTASANDVLVPAGSFGNEVQGLLTQLDGGTTTVYGIDRSLYPILQGNSISLSNAALSIDALQRLQDLAERRGGAGVNAIFSDYESRRMYQKILVADKRFANTMKGDGGFANKSETYLTFNGLPWVVDKDCPTRIFMLPKEHIEKYVLQEMEFADETGSMMIAQPEADVFEVRVRLWFNMFNAKPSASGVLTSYVSP
jgi:hypothetical protein